MAPKKRERQKKAKGSIPLEERKTFFLGHEECKRQVLKSTIISFKKTTWGAGGWGE